jgi:hypothetical protein
LHPQLERLEGRLVMSTFRVNTTLDTVAVDLRTGKDATGHISLRSAIMAANARGGSNTIKLRSGTYTLTIAGANEDASATGDLDIASNLTIKGAGSRSTVIDGNELDRVIEILRGTASISAVTLTHGLASVGGGLLNAGGHVTLSSVAVVNNMAAGANGVDGALGANGTNFGGRGGNGSNGIAAMGGGVFNAGGSLSIVNSTISSNLAKGGDGGRGGEGGSGQGSCAHVGAGQDAEGGPGGIGGAGAAAFGGGIYNAAGASLTLSGTVITSNSALGGHGGRGGGGGDAIAGNGGVAATNALAAP